MGKSRIVFDTGSLFLYFAGEENVKGMFEEVFSGKVVGYTCEVNMAEFYYKTCEKFGREVAKIRDTSVRHSKLIVLGIDGKLTLIAGGIKCAYKDKISLTDAYTLAASKMLGAILVTTDKQLAELKLVQTKLIQMP
ncbi:MAG: PIN domain-containing protein [Nitrososphaeria archaeon]